MKLKPFDPPLILVVDPASTFPLILKAVLRRADCSEVEVVAFPTPEQAIFWLSGEMDQEKATKYPFFSPWDEYPALRRPMIAIVSLSFPLDERDRIMDWLYVRYRATQIITTSTDEEVHALGDDRDELYWRRVVAHLPRPAQSTEVIELVVAALASSSS
jgi:hypothetical protein